MTLAAFLAFLEANGAWILGLWVVFEQYVASNEKLKSNSTLELILSLGKKFLSKYKKETDAVEEK